mmetsp:Transcript_62130/g.138409  ORF Transcript_62130/g.138409 Transcript_62130/m.138409 type:complete len:201 (+) Transcript_62130:138-740(+)
MTHDPRRYCNGQMIASHASLSYSGGGEGGGVGASGTAIDRLIVTPSAAGISIALGPRVKVRLRDSAAEPEDDEILCSEAHGTAGHSTTGETPRSSPMDERSSNSLACTIGSSPTPLKAHRKPGGRGTRVESSTHGCDSPALAHDVATPDKCATTAPGVLEDSSTLKIVGFASPAHVMDNDASPILMWAPSPFNSSTLDWP